MAFQTDDTWTPSAYRRAYAVWAANAPTHDGPIMPRTAQPASPRHAALSTKLRGLLTWRDATNPESAVATSWMRHDVKADNDNEDAAEYAPSLLDSETEIRPSISELRREWMGSPEKPIAYRDTEIGPVAVGGDIEHSMQSAVPEYVARDSSGTQAPRRECRVVTRIGRLEFGNGRQMERALVLRMDKPVRGDVRVPTGALVRYEGFKPVDNFRAAKGSLPETEVTVGIGGHNTGAGYCSDPVEAAEWAVTLRAAVGAEIAKVLDLAIRASNFREIGELLGKTGKHAERVGRAAVIDACERLDSVLAVNDNFPNTVDAAA